MNALPRHALGIGTVALSVLLAARIAGSPAVREPAPAPSTPVAEAAAPQAAMPQAVMPQTMAPEAAVPEQAPSHASTILARPLFEAARRPPAAGGVAAGGFARRLSGIVIAPSSRHAVFDGAPGEGRRLSLRVGESLDGWTVTGIAPEGVTLSAQGRTVQATINRGR